MRRLYSTFAEGLPGVGLLLLRLVAGTGILAHALTKLVAGLPIPAAILQVFVMSAAVLLVAGLWTPIAGLLVALLGLWHCLAHLGQHPSGKHRRRFGAPRAWCMVTRCPTFWLEADRDLRSEKLVLPKH